uniref:Uncharacterized protein n=1 Tax=Cacopsylla melanoneura TaxID=428564 RepID=A0A8D8Y082_9HEMI
MMTVSSSVVYKKLIVKLPPSCHSIHIIRVIHGLRNPGIQDIHNPWIEGIRGFKTFTICGLACFVLQISKLESVMCKDRLWISTTTTRSLNSHISITVSPI